MDNTTNPTRSHSRHYVTLREAHRRGWTLSEWCDWHEEWENESRARQQRLEWAVFMTMGVMLMLGGLALAIFFPEAASARG